MSRLFIQIELRSSPIVTKAFVCTGHVVSIGEVGIRMIVYVKRIGLRLELFLSAWGAATKRWRTDINCWHCSHVAHQLYERSSSTWWTVDEEENRTCWGWALAEQGLRWSLGSDRPVADIESYIVSQRSTTRPPESWWNIRWQNKKVVPRRHSYHPAWGSLPVLPWLIIAQRLPVPNAHAHSMCLIRNPCAAAPSHEHWKNAALPPIFTFKLRWFLCWTCNYAIA